MTLSLRKKRDGTVNIMGEFPKEHAFSSEKFTELALEGIATLTKDSDGNAKVKLTFDNGEATYDVVAMPQDGSEAGKEQPSAWILRKSRKEGK